MIKMVSHTLNVNIPNHEYPVYIGENLFTNTALLKKHIKGKQVMVVTNETLAKLYLPKLIQSLDAWQCEQFIIPDGEQYKTLTTWESILNQLAEKKHHRDSTLITLGGGVVGDMGGFAAACYQRGIAFIQIPTTLLSQVDASIGGKTAINHPIGKNLVGAFHQPKAVIIDYTVLKTLPERELKAGIAEIVKAALIKDKDFFCWLETNYQDILSLTDTVVAESILRACTIKRDIVVADEKETSIRALLNLGHTFAHAIERKLDYGKWLHGEAVAAGLVLAAKLSHHLNHISLADQNRIVSLLSQIGLPTTLPENLTIADLIPAMRMDKKVQQDKLPFILLHEIGNAFIANNVREQDLLKL